MTGQHCLIAVHVRVGVRLGGRRGCTGQQTTECRLELPVAVVLRNINMLAWSVF